MRPEGADIGDSEGLTPDGRVRSDIRFSTCWRAK